MVALAAAAMLGAPFALLHGGAAPRAATVARAAGQGVPKGLGPTELIAAARPAGPSAAVEARHRSAVRHNEEVRASRARWHSMRVHAAWVRVEQAAAHEREATAPARRRGGSSTAPASSGVAPGESPTVPLEGRSAVGGATWYAWHPGQCASPFLPHGTLLTVTDLATGKTIQCLVTDTEAHNPGRVVDLSNWCFEELAPLAQGVIEVRISW